MGMTNYADWGSCSIIILFHMLTLRSKIVLTVSMDLQMASDAEGFCCIAPGMETSQIADNVLSICL